MKPGDLCKIDMRYVVEGLLDAYDNKGHRFSIKNTDTLIFIGDAPPPWSGREWGSWYVKVLTPTGTCYVYHLALVQL